MMLLTTQKVEKKGLTPAGGIEKETEEGEKKGLRMGVRRLYDHTTSKGAGFGRCGLTRIGKELNSRAAAEKRDGKPNGGVSGHTSSRARAGSPKILRLGEKKMGRNYRPADRERKKKTLAATNGGKKEKELTPEIEPGRRTYKNESQGGPEGDPPESRP